MNYLLLRDELSLTTTFKKQLEDNIIESESKLSVKRSVSLALLHFIAKGNRDQRGKCIMARVELCLTAFLKLVEGPDHSLKVSSLASAPLAA